MTLLIGGYYVQRDKFGLCSRKERRQFRFPRTRKRRIMKKWAKNPANFREENEHFAMLLRPQLNLMTGRAGPATFVVPGFVYEKLKPYDGMIHIGLHEAAEQIIKEAKDERQSDDL